MILWNYTWNIRCFIVTRAHLEKNGENINSSSSILLMSDAQNNTGSDWALKFLGQDNTKQHGIT